MSSSEIRESSLFLVQHLSSNTAILHLCCAPCWLCRSDLINIHDVAASTTNRRCDLINIHDVQRAPLVGAVIPPCSSSAGRSAGEEENNVSTMPKSKRDKKGMNLMF